jgi:molybdopterin biosynthesis enzyme
MACEVDITELTDALERGGVPRAVAAKGAEALVRVTVEFMRAAGKFPPFNSAHEGYAVLAEEVDELWDAVKANDNDHARKEAVQVGAMAIRFLCDCPDKPKRLDAPAAAVA